MMRLLYQGLWLALAGFIMAGTVHAESWLKAETPHFVIYSNTSEAVTRLFAQKLEAYDYTLNVLYKVRNGDSDAPQPPFEIYLLRDRRDMREVWPDIDELVGGFYKSCKEGAAAFTPVDQTIAGGVGTHIAHQRTGFDYDVLYHEYAHHFMFQHYTTPLPAWFVEGFAEYFMTTTIDGRDVAIGTASQERYNTLMTAKWFDYADLLRGETTYRQSDDALTFYAQSWLLTHWIMTSPDRLQAFGRYIDAVNQGAEPTEAFQKIMGVRVADLPTVLRAYLAKGVPVVSFTFKAMPDTLVKFETLPAEANRLVLWNAAVKTCPQEQYASQLLTNIRQEAGQSARDPWTLKVLDRAEITLGDPEKAFDSLSQLNASAPQDTEAQYLMGRLLYHRAIAGDAEQMAPAKAAFLRAYKLDPMSAPTLYFLSLAADGGDAHPGATAVNAAVQASNLAPSISDYAIRAARLLIESDDSGDAATLLIPLASNPHDKDKADQALAVINAIKAGQSKTQLIQLLNAL